MKIADSSQLRHDIKYSLLNVRAANCRCRVKSADCQIRPATAHSRYGDTRINQRVVVGVMPEVTTQGAGSALRMIILFSGVAIIGQYDGALSQYLGRRLHECPGAGAILGEMAIYTGENRTASVRIEKNSTLFRLDKEKLEAMSRKFPASTAALHTYIVKVLSERLSRANRNLSRYI